MITCLLSEFLHFSHPFGATAKCIHDNLNTQKSVNSPQTYDARFQMKPAFRRKENSPSTHETNLNKLYLNHYYYYKHHWRKTKTQERTKKKTKELQRYQRSLKLRCHNKMLRMLKLWRHFASLAKRDANEEDNVYDNEFDDPGSIAYIEDSLIDDKEMDLMFKPLRIKIWYDLPNIAFQNGSLHFNRLQWGLERAVEVIQKILSGL